jgi:PKD repeat protein
MSILAALKNGNLIATSPGIARSTDLGVSWTRTYTYASDVLSICETPSGIFAISANGHLLKSTNTGASWTDLGLIDATATSCTDIGYIENNTLVVGNGPGANSAFISYNMGTSWSVLLTSPIAIYKAINMGSGVALLLGRNTSSGVGYGTKTINYGVSWTPIATLGNFNIYDAVYTGSGVVLACGGMGSFPNGTNQIYKSTDYGDNWVLSYNHGLGYWGTSIAWIPSTSYVLCTFQGVSTDGDRPFFRSANLGTSWTSLGNQGAVSLYGGSSSVLYSGRTTVLCSPVTPQAQINVSNDFGSTWPYTASPYDPTLFLEVSDLVAPVANFTADVVTGDADLTVNFTDTSTGSPTSWDWDFGDGSPHGTTQNPTHIYTKAGVFTVTLIATNGAGSDTETKVDYITVNILADFHANTMSGDADLTVNFTDDSLGEPDTWNWDFGDGTPHGTTQNPTHIYTKAGTFSVTLTASKRF